MSLDFTQLADNELALLAIAGHDEAFTEIVRRYRDGLYRIAMTSLAHPDDALDVVQDTFMAAHRTLKRFDQNRPMRPWLVRIALNHCRDRLRHRRVRRILTPFVNDDRAVDAISDNRPGHDVTIADREELVRTMRAVSALPAAIREPLVLRTIEGLTQAETAATLGITEKAVETRVRRAREKLRVAVHDN